MSESDKEKMESTAREALSCERRGVFVKTFGCQMNEYDSEKIFSLLSASHQPVESLEDAEVVFVNTCSVRQKGEHKLFSLLGRLRQLKKARPELIIGVGGCVAQQEGENILRKSPEVDFVVGTHNLSLVPSLIEGTKRGLRRQVAVDYRDEWEDLPDAFLPLDGGETIKPTFFNPVRALISIQRGCNKNCSFCIVPRTRGPEVSRPPGEIVRELETKLRLGAKEVLLLGQTVNSYGRDLEPRFSFEKLIEQLARLDGLERIRFTSPHPQDVRQRFISLYGEVPQLCPHIHLPLQSGSDRILQLMNRNYRSARYLEIVDALRDRVPKIAISTDIIVGFPSESGADFRKTLSIVEYVRYNSSYSFIYSPRPDTAASREYGALSADDRSLALKRLHELQQRQDQISEEINRTRMDKIVEVLVEGPSKNISSLMKGRIPENTLVELVGMGPKIGAVVRARVEHASAHGLRASVCGEQED